MPKLQFSLEQQFSDIRSNELAYQFKIENQGPNPILLLSITPRIPDAVTLLEVKNPSLSEVRAKYENLCDQLTKILKDYIFEHSQEIRQRLADLQVENFKRMTGSIGGIWGSYFALFSPTVRKQARAAALRSQALFPAIENPRDADSAFSNFINKLPDGDLVKQVFISKIEQLKILQKECEVDNPSEGLATIEPESFFASTYIFRFPRSIASPKKYNLTIEGGYSEVAKSGRFVGGATTSLIISPRPEVLTGIAIVASLLGVILRTAITAEGTVSQLDAKPYKILLGALIGWPGIMAAITALVFFNIYEFTALGDRLKMTLSWRSALLVGILCGVSGDRIVAALKALVGAN